MNPIDDVRAPGVRWAVLAVVAVLGLAACSGDDDAEFDSGPIEMTPPSEVTEEPTGDADAPQTVGPGQEFTIADEGEHTLVCEGGDVDIDAAATVTITGVCDDIDIEASGVVLTFEVAQDLDIDGDDNTVTGTGDLHDLDVDGRGNTVDIAGTVREIEVEGSGNTITYGGGSPSIDDEGSGNSVTGP